jgi:hypothetical protein
MIGKIIYDKKNASTTLTLLGTLMPLKSGSIEIMPIVLVNATKKN